MNKVILVGRLTNDPELKYTNESNIAYCKFGLAVDRRFKKDEEKQVDFIDIVAWRNTAEFINKYFEKGKKIGIIGRIQVTTWEDENKNKRKKTEILVEEVEFVDSVYNNTNNNTSNNPANEDDDPFGDL